MRSEFEKSLRQTDGFHDGCVTWNELSNQYESSVEEYLDIAEWMNGAFAIYQKTQSKVDDLEHENTLLRNKVSALESKLRVYPKYVKILKDRNNKLQKRVDKALERAGHACIGTAMFHKQFSDVIAILKGEQALKGAEDD